MMDVVVMEGPDGKSVKGRVNQVLNFQGLERVQATEAGPGDIVLINGIEDIGIGVTLTDPANPAPLPMLKVDEPTLTMNFCVNTSPLAGREGKFVTSRQIWDRLQKELQSNVALRVKETDEDGIFEVMGRGELHLTILLENMRREGYELAVSQAARGVPRRRRRAPRADRAGHGRHRGPAPGRRDAGAGRAQGRPGEHGAGRPGPRAPRVPHPGARPDRLPNEFLNLTRGTGLISNIFDGYEAVQGRDRQPQERRADLAWTTARSSPMRWASWTTAAACSSSANDPVYEGMIVGIHSRDNDLVVNATRTKQLTNFRVSGKEDAIKITPPIDLTLEYGVEFIEDDELVEITPKSVRLRKRYLKEHERKRASREDAPEPAAA